MSTNFRWNISHIRCIPEFGGYRDAVHEVHYRLIGQQGFHRSEVYGSVTLPKPSGDIFIQFSELTENQVISWVKTTLGDKTVRNLESTVQRLLDEKASPKIVDAPLPWVNPHEIQVLPL